MALRRWPSGSTTPVARTLTLTVVMLLLSATLVRPAEAAYWMDHTLTVHQNTFSYISHALITEVDPPSLNIEGKSDLLYPYTGGSNICQTIDGTVAYTTQISPSTDQLGYYFGAWVFDGRNVAAGDTFSESTFQVVRDNDMDGNPGPMDDFYIHWTNWVVGKAPYPVYFDYGLGYHDNGSGNCTQDGYSTSSQVGS
jgi:hypothetical protein